MNPHKNQNVHSFIVNYFLPLCYVFQVLFFCLLIFSSSLSITNTTFSSSFPNPFLMLICSTTLFRLLFLVFHIIFILFKQLPHARFNDARKLEMINFKYVDKITRISRSRCFVIQRISCKKPFCLLCNSTFLHRSFPLKSILVSGKKNLPCQITIANEYFSITF